MILIPSKAVRVKQGRVNCRRTVTQWESETCAEQKLNPTQHVSAPQYSCSRSHKHLQAAITVEQIIKKQQEDAGEVT